MAFWRSWAVNVFPTPLSPAKWSTVGLVLWSLKLWIRSFSIMRRFASGWPTSLENSDSMRVTWPLSTLHLTQNIPVSLQARSLQPAAWVRGTNNSSKATKRTDFSIIDVGTSTEKSRNIQPIEKCNGEVHKVHSRCDDWNRRRNQFLSCVWRSVPWWPKSCWYSWLRRV